VSFILRCIRDLASYERSAGEVRATEEDLRQWLFEERIAHCLIAELGGARRGFALYFLNFSTWEGAPGVYLEDLYVQPEARGKGLGTALLRYLAALCLEQGYTRVEWVCLDWNQPSLDFYHALGAVTRTGWSQLRLDLPAIRRLAEAGPR
jgi:GNAT superfamily N-acetyltransferase